MVIICLKTIQQSNVLQRDQERWRSFGEAEKECFSEGGTSGLDVDNELEIADWRLGEIGFWQEEEQM